MRETVTGLRLKLLLSTWHTLSEGLPVCISPYFILWFILPYMNMYGSLWAWLSLEVVFAQVLNGSLPPRFPTGLRLETSTFTAPGAMSLCFQNRFVGLLGRLVRLVKKRRNLFLSRIPSYPTQLLISFIPSQLFTLSLPRIKGMVMQFLRSNKLGCLSAIDTIRSFLTVA